MNLQENINRIQSMMGDIKESTNKFNGVIGKFYTFDELPQQTKQDVEDMFGDEFHDEGPDDYLYRYILISPEENESYLFSVFGEWDIEDAKEDPYMKKLVRDIKKRGLDYPSVGTEGNHRALAHYILHEPLPYLEMIPREDSDLYVQENIHRIQSMMGVIIENDGPSKIDKMINQIGLGSTIKFFGGHKNFKEVYGEDISKEDKINFINQSIKEKTREDHRDFVNPLDYLDEDLYYYHDTKETQVMSKFYVGYVIINIYRMQGWTNVFDEAIEVPYEELTEDGLNKVFRAILEII